MFDQHVRHIADNMDWTLLDLRIQRDPWHPVNYNFFQSTRTSSSTASNVIFTKSMRTDDANGTGTTGCFTLPTSTPTHQSSSQLTTNTHVNSVTPVNPDIQDALRALTQALSSVEFASRALKPTETRYSTSEKELLAVIWACEKFRGYIEFTNFTIETDDAALTWLLSLKEPRGRLARWFMTLQSYDFDIKYRPVKSIDMKTADAYSRVYSVNFIDDSDSIFRPEFIQQQSQDKFLNPIFSFLKGHTSRDDPFEFQHIKSLDYNYSLSDDGLLMKHILFRSRRNNPGLCEVNVASSHGSAPCYAIHLGSLDRNLLNGHPSSVWLTPPASPTCELSVFRPEVITLSDSDDDVVLLDDPALNQHTLESPTVEDNAGIRGI
ncbi:unnamed protein product [Allacma fusca]|uniref:Reverse transcriptase RNase H-like domain-containing protein n=1 Tax=Allacma fusca TaxID=39272 RepID=A0A8J2J915_9HEXA|nr:unnamed protein product [Allacma fusca]